MPFNLNTWQTTVKQRLQNWQSRWERLRNRGTATLYPFLAATALLPVAEAVHGGDWGALAVLGGVVAGVGSNLVANVIQGWKDEADGAQKLAAAVENDAALRAEMDAVLEKLDMVVQAQVALPETDRAWFADTLRAELAALGNLAHYEAVLTGGGTLIQGNHNVGIGERGIHVGEGVGGHVISGDHNVIHELPPAVLELFARQFGFDPTATDAEALRDYFEHVIFERHSHLSFQFIRPETGRIHTGVDMRTVFVPLQMSDVALERAARRRQEFYGGDPVPEEKSRVTMLPEILRRHSCFLLRGKPGCGKTTLLRYIALAFARGEQQEKLGWEGVAPLPLLIPLRNFGQFLKSRAGRYVDPGPRALLEYLEEFLRDAVVRFSPDFLRQRLDQGQCFLLLDALDEACGTLDGGGDLRTAVARQTAAFIRRYLPMGNRFALTSRPRAYQDDGTLRHVLSQPVVCDVLDLGPEGYRHLITNLLTVLTGDSVAGAQEAADLAARIAPNRHLTDLVSNPLLCTTLVLVYKYRGRKLPERRVDVLHEVVTLLLGRWEEERQYADSADALICLGTTAQTTEQAIRFRRRALTALAWRMQTDAMLEIAGAEAVVTLTQFYRTEERGDKTTARRWARQFLGIAHERSGLFIEMDEGTHTFAHQAFREYLAATHMVNAGKKVLLNAILTRAPVLDDWWEQTLLLASAHPEQNEWVIQRLIKKLLKREDVRYAYLAARFAQDMSDKLPGAQRKILQNWLLNVLQDPQRPAKERALAGRALALAGDPRPGIGSFSPLPEGEGPGVRVEIPDILWVEIPAGPFWMGEGEKLHQATLPAFYIARYPVTQAQFAAFTHAGGYAEPRYWIEAAQAGVWAEGKVKSWFEDAPRVRPRSFGGPFDFFNHPVVGVTWYEAVAFCRWLEEQVQRSGSKFQVWRNDWVETLATGDLRLKVCLPSEAEWEKAARGGLELPDFQNPKSRIRNPLPQRCYPWGDDPDPERANYNKTGIETTNAVGAFPGGISVYGVEELSGNVWEWTRSRYFSYPYKADDGREDLVAERRVGRVLRGGTFFYTENDARCVCRIGDFPEFYNDLDGFRVVAAPFSPTLDAVPSDL